MKPFRLLIAAAALTAVGLALPTARAADDPVEFLHALQDSGYPDIAVDYLKALKDQPNAPKEIAELWDLEMSRCLRAAAKGAYNEDEAKRFNDEAEKHLQKFMQEKPNHPAAVEAAAWAAAMAGQEALRELRMAKDLTDKAKRTAALAKAQKLLEDVRPKFVKAAADYKARLDRTPRVPPPPGGRRPTQSEQKRIDARLEAEGQWLEATLKVAITDFYLAQTLAESNPTERQAALRRAAKIFDDIFQKNRGTLYGLNAHFMQGRCEHELGDLNLALDIYEECLAVDTKDLAEPAVGRGARRKAESGNGPWDEFIAEVQQYKLQITRAKSVNDYQKEAREWLAQHKGAAERTDAYQGISLDLAKFFQDYAQKMTDADQKTKCLRQAITILRPMVKIASQYQQEAIKRLRELTGGAGGDAGAEEFIALGNDAAQAKPPRWGEALQNFQKALQALAKSKDQKQVPDVRNAVAGCYYCIAEEHFKKGAMDKVAEALAAITKDFSDTSVAPRAATLQLKIVLNDYLETLGGKDKEKQKEALAAVHATAQKIIDTWPAKAEGDEARLALLRLDVYDAGSAANLDAFNAAMDKAREVFKGLNPKSEHYATGLYLIGHTYWRQYRAMRKAAEAQAGGTELPAAERQKLDQYRTPSVKGVGRAVEVLKAARTPEKAMTKLHMDSQILLAEMLYEGGEFKDAAALYQELVDEIQKALNEKKAIDPSAILVFKGAVKCYLAIDEIEKAAKVAEVLVKSAPDVADINDLLVIYGRRLDQARKKQEEAVAKAVTQQEIEDAKKKRDDLTDKLRSALTTLAAREKVAGRGMLWVARTCAELGMADEAEAQAKKIREMIDEGSNESVEGAGAAVSSLLTELMLKKHKYKEARDQAQNLIKDKPKSLEPRMLLCRIYQTWSEKEPEHWGEAVVQWDRLRRMLENMKKRPPDFYEVEYQEAKCLHDWAKKCTAEKERLDHAKTGEQILRQRFVLDKNLSREWTAKYSALADKLAIVQGKQPSAGKKPDGKKPDASKKGP